MRWLPAVLFCFISLFQWPQCARAATENILYNFKSNFAHDAFAPHEVVSDGSALFGVSTSSGANFRGAVFTINTDGTGYQILHNFDSAAGGGYNPVHAMTLSGTTLYGVTTYGGTNGTGTIYKINTDGTGYQTVFNYGTDLIYPSTSLVLSGTTLYGLSGGGGSYSQGAIYKVNTDGTGYQIVHDFGSIPGDASGRSGIPAPLVLSGGWLYGCTPLGGSADWGATFKINTDGTGYQILHSFYTFTSDGANPAGVTVVGSAVYGSARVGGAYSAGMIYKVNTDGGGYQILHQFLSVANDGARPDMGFVVSGSILYGVTLSDSVSITSGTAYQINTDGSGYQQIHHFGSTSQDGVTPNGPLLMLNGNLYGTTYGGGANTYSTGYSYAGCGTIFSIGAPKPAGVKSPSNASALGASSATFTWSAGTGVTRYALWVGSMPGTNNFYSAYEDGPLSDTVSNLPADGRTFYVTLWSMLNGTWTPISYEYTALDNRTQMTSPAGGSRFTSASATFNWGATAGATNCALWVGSSPGTYDLYVKVEGSSLSDTVNNLPVDGRAIYVRLYSMINGAWVYKSYTYTAVDNRAQMTSPASNGSALGASSVNFSWNTGTGVSAYALWVGSSPGGNDLYAKIEGSSLSDTVNNLPLDGRAIYVTLWSYLNGRWVTNNYNYTALDNKARMTSPVNNSVLGSTSVNFTWAAGTGASQYALWVGSTPGAYDLALKLEGSGLSDTVNIASGLMNGHTIYVRLYSMINGAWVYNSYAYTVPDNKAQMISPAGGSPLNSTSATFNWSASPGASAYGLWVGSSPGAYDLYIKNEGGSLSDTVNNLPTDGRRIYVRLYTQSSAGWRFNAYTYDALTSSTGSPSVLTSHANGSTLASSSAAFAWNAGIGATAYALWVGSTPGGNELYSALEKNGLADTVANIPEDGSPVYVTLWSLINGQWQSTKSHFATTAQGTSPKGLLTSPSPPNGSTVNTGQLTLNWSAGASTGTQYALWVGSSPGTYDVYFKLEGTSLSDTVQVPLDGRRLYVVLWTSVNGAWQPTTYYYDTTE